jgi:DNA-binding transcriptional MerR regulator
MLYLISDAARRVPCSAATLRAYAKRGVISPVRDSGGRRLFTDEDVQRAREQLSRSRVAPVALQ